MGSDNKPADILVVEDDLGHVELLERSFEGISEFSLSAVHSLKAARERIATQLPDLILTDYLLPDGAGQDILSSTPASYPVVVMTSHGNEQIAVELMKAGALDYIVKSPDSFEQMPQVVRRALREWRLRCEHDAAQKELARINASLEQRVREEVAKNLEKDRMLAHQARLAAMGEMLRDIAHQWRQPLNNIALIVQNICMEHENNELSNESCHQQVSQCLATLKYLSETINLFRTFYQPDYSPQLFSLAEAVEAAVKLMRPGIEASGIELQLNIDTAAEIQGYRNELVNAIINIINNAREAISEHHPPTPFIRIDLQQDSNVARLTIRDNGGGVPDQIKEKIFDPYFTTKFKSQGTGIGLYMARSIIETTTGGSISVANDNGGAAFILLFPLKNASLQEKQQDVHDG